MTAALCLAEMNHVWSLHSGWNLSAHGLLSPAQPSQGSREAFLQEVVLRLSMETPAEP